MTLGKFTPHAPHLTPDVVRRHNSGRLVFLDWIF
jgi:hypothetical protein